MDRAVELVSQFVLAGFTKIHLDTSMRLASDSKTARLSDATIARRGARLCKAAEAAYAKRLQAHPDAIAPVYVIGSEVPIPGGAQEAEDSISVTNLQTAWPPMRPSISLPGGGPRGCLAAGDRLGGAAWRRIRRWGCVHLRQRQGRGPDRLPYEAAPGI